MDHNVTGDTNTFTLMLLVTYSNTFTLMLLVTHSNTITLNNKQWNEWCHKMWTFEDETTEGDSFMTSHAHYKSCLFYYSAPTWCVYVRLSRNTLRSTSEYHNPQQHRMTRQIHNFLIAFLSQFHPHSRCSMWTFSNRFCSPILCTQFWSTQPPTLHLLWKRRNRMDHKNWNELLRAFH
jgi:hypothetical protein